MADVPTTEPAQIRAGDTIKWTKSLADYPASTWTLSYRLINGVNTIDITASADGDDHSVEVSHDISEHYVAGDYDWFSFVTDGSERYTLDRGVVTVLPDAATAT